MALPGLWGDYSLNEIPARPIFLRPHSAFAVIPSVVEGSRPYRLNPEIPRLRPEAGLRSG